MERSDGSSPSDSMTDPVPQLLVEWLGGHSAEVMIADRTGRLVFANDAACRWRGCERAHILQEHLHDFDATLGREWAETTHLRWKPGVITLWQSWREAPDGRRIASSFRVQVLRLQAQRFLMLSSAELDLHRDVEQELKRTLAFVQGIIDAFPDFLFEGSADGRYLNTWTKNPELLAASREFMIGRTLDEVLPPESAAIAKEAFREADEKGLSFGKVISIDTELGRHWYELSVSKMPMGEGQAPHFITVSRDVTARLNLQAALEDKERQFRTLVENSPDMIARFDPVMRCLYANPALAMRTRFQPAALTGMTPLDFLESVPAEDLLRQLADVFRAGKAQHFEMNWADARGAPVSFLVSLTPEFDTQNHIHSVLLVGRDIGELRAYEDRIHRLVESNIIGVLFWRADGCIEDGNESILRLLGYTRSDVLSGLLRWDRLTPSGHEQVDARAAEEIRRSGTCRAYEKELLHRDGRRVPVLVGSAMLDGEQQLGVTYVLDLTEQRRAEAESRAREAAEAASQAKGAFLARMSHEIRTPLHAVLGMAYLTERETRESTTRERLQKITRAGRSLLNLINDILDYSKIEAGLLRVESTPFDLQAVLDNVAAIMGSAVSNDAVEVVVGSALRGVRHVVGDAFRIEQVLINLTGNALKFTREGHVDLSVKVIDRVQNRVTVKFSVEDTGIGLSREQMERLFKPFSQAEASTSRRFGGTGLGLSICKQLVDLMRGEIGVESTEGRGSVFWFTVELGLTDGEWPAPAAVPKLHVLLAIAHERTRHNLAQMCEELDWGVSIVVDKQTLVADVAGAGAGTVATADVVLIEWDLDAGSDLALARRLREAPAGRGVGMVAVTNARAAQELGAVVADGTLDAVLTRPVTRSTLLEGVGHAMHRSGRPWAMAASDGHGVSMALRGMRVMVVDDNDINRELASSILSGHGAAVVTAADGEAALNVLHADRDACDIVLMDLQMPGMDGMQTTSRIRQLSGCERLPIVALTASAFAEQREVALGAGMDAVVTKPFEVDSLMRLLVRLVGRDAGGSALPALASPLQPKADPSGHLPLLDFNRGLQLWQDLEQYHHYLRLFSQEHEGVEERAHAMTPDELVHWVHKTRGSAAGLALPSVAGAASRLEEHLRMGASDPLEVAHFASEIRRTSDAIRERLHNPDSTELS